MMSLGEKKEKINTFRNSRSHTHALPTHPTLPHVYLSFPPKIEQGSNKTGRETGIKKGKKMG